MPLKSLLVTLRSRLFPATKRVLISINRALLSFDLRSDALLLENKLQKKVVKTTSFGTVQGMIVGAFVSMSGCQPLLKIPGCDRKWPGRF
jgi:hypothetical protein